MSKDDQIKVDSRDMLPRPFTRATMNANTDLWATSEILSRSCRQDVMSFAQRSLQVRRSPLAHQDRVHAAARDTLQLLGSEAP